MLKVLCPGNNNKLFSLEIFTRHYKGCKIKYKMQFEINKNKKVATRLDFALGSYFFFLLFWTMEGVNINVSFHGWRRTKMHPREM